MSEASVRPGDVASDLMLEARGIVRRYAGNVALKGVTFRVHRNQVNVLIGENGAGKSTLMKILAGVEQPDEGEIVMDGELIHMRSPRDARDKGIAIVHQELSVLPNLDVSENIFAGRELVRAGMAVDRGGEDRRSVAALERLRTDVGVTVELSRLSLGQRQMVELARVVAHGAKLLILDEPTSSLSATETESLFHVMEEMKRAGVTIIYISHRLHEMLHLGDTFTVLRSGEVVGEALRGEVSREWIVERMSGRPCREKDASKVDDVDAPIVLRAEDIRLAASVGTEDAQSAVEGVCLELREGEVLGIYGLLGSGRTELLDAMAGGRRMLEGKLSLHGKVLRLSCVGDAVKAGIVLVPEDRQRDGLIPEMSVRENIALASSGGVMLSRKEETAAVQQLVAELKIAAHDIELPVTALSGGNQQKVILARCLMRSPKVLLMDEPTRGVDVNAKAEIYAVLRALADKGLGIVFTSSEIEETRTLADRVLVMRQGKIAAEFLPAELSDELLFAAASPQVGVGTRSRNGGII